MKNQIIMLVISLAMTMGSFPVKAQKIDHEKMQRDIQVAETVLSSLLKGRSNNFIGTMGSKNSSRYIEGYGVILHLPAQNFFSAGYSTHAANVIFDKNGEGNVIALDGGAIQINTGTSSISYATVNKDSTDNSESLNEKPEDKTMEVIKTFLLDYADLIGQLDESDRILIMESKSPFHVLIAGEAFNYSTPKKNKFSAEIKKSDLNAFKTGEISKEEALNKIKITTPDVEVPVEQDIELLASIFDRLYRPDLSKTYFIAGKAEYDYIPDFGVIYHINLVSSNLFGSAKLFGTSQTNKEPKREEQDQKVKELYPQFEKDFLENILEYGRTIKSLKEEEHLVFNAKIAECAGCGIPESVEASIKSIHLKEYGEGKINKEEALGKMQITKGTPQ